MRCLYCGNHLPLLRKLTGGGEFCSDAHRDRYYDEYNKLAVSRLLQAQSRPEETKPRARASAKETGAARKTGAAEETKERAAVVVAEEPERELVSRSFIETFETPQIRPAVVHTQCETQVAPLGFESWGPVHPSVQATPFSPVNAGFLPSCANSRRIATVSTETGPPSHGNFDPILLPASEFRFADWYPEQAGPVALNLPSVVRILKIEPLDSGVNAVEVSPPKPVIAETASVPDGPVPPHAGPRQLVLSSIAPAEDGEVEIERTQNFPALKQFRPAFELTLKVLEAAEDVIPEREAVLLTPRQVLEVLNGDRKNKPQEPPLSRTLKPIVVTSAASVTEVLAAGFDSMLFQARPRLLHYSTHPLRPRMAIGCAAGPVSARSGPDGTVRNGGTRMMQRSMLHLENDNQESEADPEAPSLFGKLGGLFGKKSRMGKHEVGSQK